MGNSGEDDNETFVCICHGDCWTTEPLMLEHQVAHYSQRCFRSESNYNQLFRLFQRQHRMCPDRAIREDLLRQLQSRRLKEQQKKLDRDRAELQKQQQQIQSQLRKMETTRRNLQDMIDQLGISYSWEQ